MPTNEAAPVRVSEPLPFTFSPRNSGGKMTLQSLDFSRQSDMLPALNYTAQVTPRIAKKAKLFVPLNKIQFDTKNSALLSSRA